MQDIILNPQLKKEKQAIVLKPIKNKNDIKKDKEYNGYLINASEKQVRAIIDSLKSTKSNKLIAVIGRDDVFNRRVIETCKIDYLVSPERGFRRDSVKQRDSGLNHVIAKEAGKRKISIVINFSELFDEGNRKKKERAEILARIMQNIKICRRAKCKIKIATLAKTKEQLRTENELGSFGFSLGMSSQQVKEGV